MQRQKEIGIRKVMGASVNGIILLLSRDFAKLILISITIASPLAWFSLNKWLQNFAYRTELGIDIFLIAGGFALLVALLTVSWQSIKVALMNPVESLRSE
ncbi:MAG: FtsX-like permease family protein [Balneolaceae bacterium]